MDFSYERQLFESQFPDLDFTRTALDGYESGPTSLMWEAWKRCAARIPERRDMKDPRPAEDEPRICSTNRYHWRCGFNTAIESANP